MTTSHLAELLAYANEHTGPVAQRQDGFVAAYFENTDPDEIVARGPATLYAVANAHWRLLDIALDTQRKEPSPKVRVFNPTLAEDGFVSEHTVIQIVNDNMPFLVDSVTMAVNRSGRTAHWIVHPLMSVARSADGSIAAISPVASGNNESVESLILVECDRIVAESERNALAQELIRVLADVRSAVVDWRAMLARVQSISAASEKAPLPEGNRAEGVAFLRWLEERHFTFLGARDYDLKRDGDIVSMVAKPETGLGILRASVQTSEIRLSPEALA